MAVGSAPDEGTAAEGLKVILAPIFQHLVRAQTGVHTGERMSIISAPLCAARLSPSTVPFCLLVLTSNSPPWPLFRLQPSQSPVGENPPSVAGVLSGAAPAAAS